MKYAAIYRTLLVFMITLILTSCNLLDSRQVYHVEIKTEKELYSLSEADSYVTAKLKNNSFYPVYWMQPGGVSLQKRVENEWIDLGQWYITIGIAPSLGELEPGFVINPATPRLHLTDYIVINNGPGLYRFAFALYSEKREISETIMEVALPLEDRVSNVFEIVE